MNRQIEHNIIPQGYKSTPLGIIPQEWEVKRLGDIAQCFSGGTPKARNNKYYGGNIPFIRSGEIHQKDTELFLSEMGIEESSAKMVQKGDLLMALYGANSGDSAVSQIDGAINQAILCIRPRKLLVSFLCPYLELNKDMYISKYLQGGQGNLSGEIVLNYKIPVPPLAEQQKIAEILGTWDKAIEKQSQLIEQLTLRKRGLMQQLLTAKRRLPGFSEPWKKVRLGDIGSPYNGLSGKNKENFESGDACFIPYINIFLNERIDINNLESVEIGIEEHQNKVKYGDIFFTVSSETPNEVGMSSVLLESLNNTYLNSFCFGYRLNDFLTLSPFFATYLFRAEYFRHCMYILAQGSTRFNISKSDVMNLKINVPSIEEQTAIAQILTAADCEIELAQQKLELLRQQKRGLMQQLLTGKKRVKL